MQRDPIETLPNPNSAPRVCILQSISSNQKTNVPETTAFVKSAMLFCCPVLFDVSLVGTSCTHRQVRSPAAVTGRIKCSSLGMESSTAQVENGMNLIKIIQVYIYI